MDLRGASHEEAIAALRQTPSKVCLTVLRDEAQYRDEENLDIFQVELQKRSGRGLGLSIVGKRSVVLGRKVTAASSGNDVALCVCVSGVGVVSLSPRWSEGALLSWMVV